MSSTLLLPGDAQPMTSAREIRDRLQHQVQAVLDGGDCGIEPTTVIDLDADPPTVLRLGKGQISVSAQPTPTS
jgi:tRNA A37 threonylcarbamoyladenosine synthetase subunit TsaC/SUA5/YrdC